MSIISKDNVLNFIKPLFSKRNDFSSKRDFGHGVVIGGSINYLGAPTFTNQANEETLNVLSNLLVSNGDAGMEVGLGTSGIAAPDFFAPFIHKSLKYSAFYPLTSSNGYILFKEDEIENLANKTNAFAIGMGMGEGDAFSIVNYLLEGTNCYMIIDADALEKCKDLDFKNRAILTPHIGEMSKLTGLSVDEISLNQEEVALNYAKEHNCIVILKNFVTTISNGFVSFSMRFGNAKLAKGGSGDVLSGILLGLVGSNLKAEACLKDGYELYKDQEEKRNKLMTIALCGNYILGRCAEISPVNEFSHKPEDIVAQIENVIKELL